LEVPVDGHDIQGRIDGFGTLYLKSSVVKSKLLLFNDNNQMRDTMKDYPR